MTKNKITALLAEDEETLAQIIKESLETRDFKVFHCHNGQEAIDSFYEFKPDVMILDVMMPVKDGYSVAAEIRKTDKHIPIIFLSAKSQTHDVIDGFKSGGNDYLKKPFSMEELIIRIRALLYRNELMQEDTIFKIGKYNFSRVKQELVFQNTSQKLTHRESELLYCLYQNKNRIIERSIILILLWGTEDFFTTRSMDVFITKLRKKLDQDDSIEIINIRNQGYKLLCP
ncbi:response regulator transcription factor [Flavobacterium glaciei]|uniref:DNA-binding response OmpR family regulator n=1 Tax=Flavobacterium glaciei TaxID=386300 RepID=A0A562PN83_9FLAO|nr:response regulator transcription factor [Flavobacterium glaciei]RDI52370.1 DNA-binding response OmpR family regulator [Flavobacterium glaciei]TWI45660.1 DNA-binding response OmpR family regulator [Flavobacterium glaciei]